VVSRSQLDYEIRTGRLAVPFRRALCRPWDADFLRERAALVSIGPPAALSHTTALRQRRLLDASIDELVHVSVPADRSPRPQPGLQVHRLGRMPPIRRVDGLPTTALPDALVTAWPLLRREERRGPLIQAVRQRLVRADELEATLAATSRVADRAELQELITLLATGCESELEIWGYLGVFDIPGLRHGRRQLWVSTPEGRYRVDIGYEEERVAVELDGAQFHASREQRERDMRRDAAFAAIDWVTLRFSHRRLHADVPGCRRDTLATLAARRRPAP
jgi:very-short-patch-repair endonuclease